MGAPGPQSLSLVHSHFPTAVLQTLPPLAGEHDVLEVHGSRRPARPSHTPGKASFVGAFRVEGAGLGTHKLLAATQVMSSMHVEHRCVSGWQWAFWTPESLAQSPSPVQLWAQNFGNVPAASPSDKEPSLDAGPSRALSDSSDAPSPASDAELAESDTSMLAASMSFASALSPVPPSPAAPELSPLASLAPRCSVPTRHCPRWSPPFHPLPIPMRRRNREL
jgi:hypothetical protein